MPILIEELKEVIALNELPDEHLRWILERSEYAEYEDGDVVARFGDPADVMWIILEGKVTFYMNVNGIQVYYFTFENTPRPQKRCSFISAQGPARTGWTDSC